MTDQWLELISKSLSMVRAESWVSYGGRWEASPGLAPASNIRGWPSRTTGRRRPGPSAESGGSCVLSSDVKLTRGGGSYQVVTRGQTCPPDVTDMRLGVLCVDCCVRETAAMLSWIIENKFTLRDLFPRSLAIFYPCVLMPDNLIPSCRTLLQFLTLRSEARTGTGG